MPPRAGGRQMRRNSGPAVRPAASCQRRSARTGQSAVVPSGRATVTPLPARSPLESGRVRRSPRAAGSRCSRRIAASSARRSAPAKPTSSSARSRRPGRSSPIGARISRSTPTAAASFFAGNAPRWAGVAADAGHGLADHRLGGRHRAAGEVVQIADRGAAQVDGADRKAALALGGEEGHDVGGAGGQAGQRMARRTRRTRRRPRRGRRGACCPPWPAARSRPRWRARSPACRRTAGSATVMLRSNQRRTWAGGAPSGAGAATARAGRGAGAASGASLVATGAASAASLMLMSRAPGGFQPVLGGSGCAQLLCPTRGLIGHSEAGAGGSAI